MTRRLAGKVAIITGAASGIGAASARLFAAEGATLALADIDEAAVAALAAEIVGNGGDAIAQRTDVSDSGQVAAMVDAAVARLGRLDVLFSNAGIGGAGVPVTETPEEAWDRIVDVNLKGGFLCAKYAIPHLLAGGGGAVIFTASELALVGSPGGAVYCASKAGLIGMARAMALDHGAEGLRVTCICPGATDTPMLWRNVPDRAEEEASLAARMALGRVGRAEEIARAALFLASDDASFVTGTALVVDGGWTAR
jgi:NAD(P)-dependent dehydrogenase (short-subunit alcohol dehydrogenase family)